MMIICQLQQVSQTYAANEIFQNITIEIQRGERIGLVGRNGVGKTALLKLIAGKTKPSAGTVTWKKDLVKGILDQLPDVDQPTNVLDLLYASFAALTQIKDQMKEMEQKLAQTSDPGALERDLQQYGRLQEQFEEQGGYEIDANIQRVAHGLNMAGLLEKEWGQLSGGERTKVGLAQLLLRSPDLLLLDEPTNHLDLSAVEWLTAFIQQYSGTVVLVSHDRYFLDQTVTKIIELERGEYHLYHQNYSGYVREREERLLHEFQQYQDQQKKIKKMREAIKRLKEWANRSNPPNDGLHRRAKSMEKALARIELVKKPVLEQKKIRLDFQQQRSGNEVVKLKAVCKAFGERQLLREVDMLVRYGERVAIVGENGSGKTTLLQLLTGTQQADAGQVQIGSNVSIGYLSQHGTELNAQHTVLEAFRDEVPVTEGEARGILAQFLFYGEAVFRQVGKLSGGEHMRLRLAQLVHQRHNLLILDEPTNHLDIDSREVLEEALSEFNGTLLVVSHDRYFLDRLFQITYWLEEGALIRYEGNYSYASKQRNR